MASAWGKSWGNSWNGAWGSIATIQPQVGDNRFWRKGKRPFPRYWWEKDPLNIPDDLPLIDLLEEVEKEEIALLEFIDTVGDDHTSNEILRVLRAYAEILHDQAEMKRASIEMQRELKRETIRKSNHRKAIAILLN